MIHWKRFAALGLAITLMTATLSGCEIQKIEDPSSVPQVTSTVTSKSYGEQFKENGQAELLNFKKPKKGDPVATMKTTMGDIKLVFFKDVAPKAVENFLTHAEDGYFDNILFFQVFSDYIQSGDPRSDGTGGKSIWINPFKDEFSEKALHFRGAISMVNAGFPDTNASQFFIVRAKSVPTEVLTSLRKEGYPQSLLKKYSDVGGLPRFDFKHTVFGRVLEGMDVVDNIAAVKTDNSAKPIEDVVIKTVEVGTYE